MEVYREIKEHTGNMQQKQVVVRKKDHLKVLDTIAKHVALEQISEFMKYKHK